MTISFLKIDQVYRVVAYTATSYILKEAYFTFISISHDISS